MTEKKTLTVEDLLLRESQLLWAKRQDYASEESPLSNFYFSAEVLAIANAKGVSSTFLPYFCLIAVKMARIMELLGQNKPATNEPLVDSCVDAANYFTLLGTAIAEEFFICAEEE